MCFCRYYVSGVELVRGHKKAMEMVRVAKGSHMNVTHKLIKGTKICTIDLCSYKGDQLMLE